jgi:hypothetical protein
MWSSSSFGEIPMPQQTLEERVTRLEEQTGRLLRRPERSEKSARPDASATVTAVSEEPGSEDWESTVGMFRGDPVFKEMIDEATRRREEERRGAREESEREPT